MTSFLTDPDEIEAIRTGKFFKATASGSGQGGGCVETAEAGEHHVLLRDSKNRSDGAFLLPRPAFAELIEAIKAGQFDHLA